MRIVLVPLVAAGLVLAGATAAVAKPAYSVTVKVNHTTIDYGASVTISGTVSGGAVKGKKVTLYWSHDESGDTDGWHTIGTDALSSKGAFSKSFKPKEGGQTYFRAAMAKTSKTAAGSSHTTSQLKVYQWQSIWSYWNNGLDETDGSNGATAVKGTGHVNGTTYKNALLIGDGASAGFASYECKAFRGVVGVGDSSTWPGGSATVYQDGSLLVGATVAKGKATASVTTTLSTNAGVEVRATIGGSGGTTNVMVVANPQVKCNAPA